MYIVTHYVTINGATSELIHIKSGFFKSFAQCGEYEAILTQLEQYKHTEKVSVNIIHKVGIKAHKDWNKVKVKRKNKYAK